MGYCASRLTLRITLPGWQGIGEPSGDDAPNDSTHHYYAKTQEGVKQSFVSNWRIFCACLLVALKGAIWPEGRLFGSKLLLWRL